MNEKKNQVTMGVSIVGLTQLCLGLFSEEAF